MATEVILPKVDMDMSTGTISKWHVVDGEAVKKGQQIFEIETDKSAMEIEAPADGVIKIGNAKSGIVLPIGSVVGMIYGAKENPLAFVAPIPVGVAQLGAKAPLIELRLRGSDAEKNAMETGVVRATPMSRRLARELAIELSALEGTGPQGRVVAEDVSAAKLQQSNASNNLPRTDGLEVKPFDGMRRIIAQRLTQAKQTIPHFYLHATCTIDDLLDMRTRMNAQMPDDEKLSINDFIIKALALALQKVHGANVTYSDGGIVQHKHSDIAVAVAVEGGLYTPIIRQAELKTFRQISTEMKDLVARAKARRLTPADYQGGTSAISNLGMYGVEQFTAIINPPQSTILAVGASVERFIPFNKQPLLVTQMSITLSCDHRVIDGSVGARLIKSLKELIEMPALNLE